MTKLILSAESKKVIAETRRITIEPTVKDETTAPEKVEVKEDAPLEKPTTEQEKDKEKKSKPKKKRPLRQLKLKQAEKEEVKKHNETLLNDDFLEDFIKQYAPFTEKAVHLYYKIYVVGYGEKTDDPKAVTTEPEALKVFEERISEIKAYLLDVIDRKLNQNQFNALVSALFFADPDQRGRVGSVINRPLPKLSSIAGMFFNIKPRSSDPEGVKRRLKEAVLYCSDPEIPVNLDVIDFAGYHGEKL